MCAAYLVYEWYPSDPDRLLRARGSSGEQGPSQGPSFEMQPSFDQIEKPEILVEEPTDQEQNSTNNEAEDDEDEDDSPASNRMLELQVNLISPPAEESESSTAVLDSEGIEGK